MTSHQRCVDEFKNTKKDASPFEIQFARHLCVYGLNAEQIVCELDALYKGLHLVKLKNHLGRQLYAGEWEDVLRMLAADATYDEIEAALNDLLIEAERNQNKKAESGQKPRTPT